MSDRTAKPKPAKPRGPWLKNPREPRKGETIGGGFFVFRRGDQTGRIRPAQWPFEYATVHAAMEQADRLAKAMPGYRFDVVGICYSAVHLPEGAAITATSEVAAE